MSSLKKRSVMFVILAILVISLFGCGRGGRRQDPSTAYLTGSQGLVLRFLPNAPPYKVYDKEQFSFIIEVANRGSFPNDFTKNLLGIPTSSDVFEGRLILSGFDPTYLTPETQVVNLDRGLYGKDPYNTEGTQQIIQIGATASLQNIPSPITQSYKAEVCYIYMTYASPTVCIDPDPYSQSIENEICVPHDIDALGTQGAPIAITRVEEDSTKTKVKFTFEIQNVGTGYPFTIRNGYSTCPRFEYKDIDKVLVAQVMVSNTDITASCKGVDEYGYARLINRRATVTCEYCLASTPSSGGQFPLTWPFSEQQRSGYTGCGTPNMAAGSAFETPLRIVLAYGYYDSIQGQLRIFQS